MAASTAKIKRVMKRAGKLRKEGKSASAAMRAAWKEEKGSSTPKSSKAKNGKSGGKGKSTKSGGKGKKKFLGLF